MGNYKASIDIGSNSTLLLIVKENLNTLETVESLSTVTGLGRDLDQNQSFLKVAMDETFAALKQYKNVCEKYKIAPESVIITATEASRVALNTKDFFFKIKQDLGFNITILTGEGEAYYSTLGVLFDQQITEKLITIMDIGGASTELIQVNTQTKEIVSAFSMPVGVVRLNNWHEEEKRLEKLNQILDKYADQINGVSFKKIHCVAGTMTSVGNMFLNKTDFIESEVNGLTMLVEDVKEMKRKYASKTPEEFLSLFPFLGKRCQTIYSGLILATEIFERLGANSIYVSTYGLRYGTLLVNKIEDQYVWKRS